MIYRYLEFWFILTLALESIKRPFYIVYSLRYIGWLFYFYSHSINATRKRCVTPTTLHIWLCCLLSWDFVGHCSRSLKVWLKCNSSYVSGTVKSHVIGLHRANGNIVPSGRLPSWCNRLTVPLTAGRLAICAIFEIVLWGMSFIISFYFVFPSVRLTWLQTAALQFFSTR